MGYAIFMRNHEFRIQRKFATIYVLNISKDPQIYVSTKIQCFLLKHEYQHPRIQINSQDLILKITPHLQYIVYIV
jgi:hypothetical protein